jgi:SRSO17 transposase
LKGFGAVFLCYRTNNVSKCGQFLSGLLHDCKSNIERMAERIPESDYDQLHHFVSESPWDSFAVMDLVSEKMYDTLSAKNTPISSKKPSIGLELDESGWEKAGKKSVGVAQQYIGQVGVFVSLCDGEQVGLLQDRLYLPQEWVNNKDRCDKAEIPPTEQIYRTKPELTVEFLKTLPNYLLTMTE